MTDTYVCASRERRRHERAYYKTLPDPDDDAAWDAHDEAFAAKQPPIPDRWQL